MNNLFFVKVESNKCDFVMVPKFKQNAAALKRQVSAEFNSRNIVDLTQLIAYNPDEKVHTNCFF